MNVSILRGQVVHLYRHSNPESSIVFDLPACPLERKACWTAYRYYAIPSLNRASSGEGVFPHAS
jgi:hypothetical protein